MTFGHQLTYWIQLYIALRQVCFKFVPVRELEGFARKYLLLNSFIFLIISDGYRHEGCLDER